RVWPRLGVLRLLHQRPGEFRHRFAGSSGGTQKQSPHPGVDPHGVGQGAAHRPSRLRQGHAERRANCLSLPAQCLFTAHHQRGGAQPGAYSSAASTSGWQRLRIAMTGQTITIKGKDGDFPGYLASPGPGRGPGLVVIQEIFGVNTVMREIADGMASRGYFALVPDLFWRLEPDIQLTDKTDADWKKAL